MDLLAERNKQLTSQWFEEVWNQRRLATLMRMPATGVMVHGLGDGGRDLIGTEQFLVFYQKFTGAFPDLRLTMEQVIGEGDTTAFRFRGEGTHLGDGIGIAPTGRRVRFSCIGMLRWRDGKIVEAWNEFDAMGMFQQLTDEPLAAMKA